jgi:hypothetical protein
VAEHPRGGGRHTRKRPEGSDFNEAFNEWESDMMATWKKLMVVAALLVAAAQTASAQTAAAAAAFVPRPGMLLGTTGACHNLNPGGGCTETSTLVQLNPATGALIRTIGPVGYTVNGMVWDPRTRKLYASTSIGDASFHGLITINPATGKGTPVNPAATNFGLAGDPSPIHSITVDFLGNMVAWYDEKPAPGVTDTFVRINKATGIATEFPSTGIDTNQNGLAFQLIGPFSVLWNIDSPKTDPVSGVTSQNAYVLNASSGKTIVIRPLTLATTPLAPPPVGDPTCTDVTLNPANFCDLPTCKVPAFFCDGHTVAAALGDFNPRDLHYYGLDFPGGRNVPQVGYVRVEPILGRVTAIGPALDNLHVLAFIKN